MLLLGNYTFRWQTVHSDWRESPTPSPYRILANIKLTITDYQPFLCYHQFFMKT